ncbi:Farnesyl pyrophosphate synthase [Penicillium longicatenatum]|uniref:Farnesyl pyrophosphate synthase n=1 Tax=Penicillium longicatenatum TaxID=1561947 RepID=UPI0025483132|nr:Farnesyl pyrophosphate synthase [Penicillium longicatenatum]KAJ5643711.1 Farnesyl pyrophosphate synthase [Penicillium longicatenatum]
MADREKFQAVLPSILTDLDQDLTRRGTPKALKDRFLACLRSNVQGGKLNRGLIVLNTGHVLLPRPLSAIEIQHLSILGWLTELFQAAYLIWDDIMDSSEYRRGQPCWYRRDGIGLSAINDACLIKSSIMVLLRQYFGDHPSYCEMMELFDEAAFRTELGQLADMTTSNECSLAEMTMERYAFTAENKTAFYSFYLPVALALQYLQHATEQNLTVAREILLRMGRYFQVQDDYFDVFGDPKITGKVGTDIRDNKCSWMALKVFELSSSEQKAILSLCYGKPDTEKEASVKDVFCQVNIEDVFKNFETTELDNLEKQIDQIGGEYGLLKNALWSVLGKISRRDK